MKQEAIIAKAVKLRKALGEDSSSPVDVFALAQTMEKLTIVRYPMGENISGMCVKGKSGECTIAVNSAMSLGRQRFSLAHELFHMNYDDNMTSICGKNIGIGGETEKDADSFASYFLMPLGALEEKAEEYAERHPDKKLILADIIALEQYFRVSHKAVMFRLKNNEHMDMAQYEALLSSPVARQAERLGYSRELYLPTPDGMKYSSFGHYITQAEILLERGIISEGKYDELLMDAFRADLVYGVEEEGVLLD